MLALSALYCAQVDGFSAGDSVELHLCVSDKFGNPQSLTSAETEAISVCVNKSTIPFTSIGGESGLVIMHLTCSQAGDSIIRVKMNDLEVSNHLRVTVVAAKSCACKSKVEFEKESSVVIDASSTAKFKVRTFDAYGNERRTGGDRVHVEIRGPTTVLASVADCGDGTYAVSYTCCASGSYQVHVSVNGAAIASSPFEMNVTAAASSAQHCLVQWTDVQSAVAGEAFSFKVEARDRFLNKRRVGGDAFRVQCSQRMETATTDHGDGSYTVSCTLFEAGSNVCFVMLGEDAVGTEGFRADVSAAAVDVASCRVLGEGLKGARAGEEADVVVVLSDKYGNRTGDGFVTLSVEQCGKPESRSMHSALHTRSGVATLR